MPEQDEELLAGVTGQAPYVDHLWLPRGHEWWVKDIAGWRVTVSPMLYNYRIHLTSEEDRALRLVTAGFCYNPKDLAMIYATVWDPVTELRPQGFIKEAFNGRRKGWWRGCSDTQLEDLVDQWHARYDGKPEYDVKPLHEWLGMRPEEYAIWVTDPDYRGRN